MKKALNRWCLPSEMALSDVIELCATLGYQGLELNVGESGDITLQTSAAEAGAMARQAQAAGVELHAVSTNLHWRTPLSSSDAEVRDRGMAVGRKQLEVAAAFGAAAILVVPGLVTAQDRYDHVWARALESIGELAQDAARLGVHIGVENVGNYFLQSPLELRDFVDAIGSPYVGVYYDVGNTVACRQGWPQQWIEILGSRLRKVHVKDHRATGTGLAAGIAGAALLAGDTIHWPEVMAALQRVDYDDYLTVEISPYPHYPTKVAEDAARSLDWLLGITAAGA
jgi:L-ribulose-5-phosphate 3-epimerase